MANIRSNERETQSSVPDQEQHGCESAVDRALAKCFLPSATLTAADTARLIEE